VKSRIVTHAYDRQSKKSRIHSLSVRNIVLWAAETAPSGRILTKTLPDGLDGNFTNLLFPLIPISSTGSDSIAIDFTSK